MKSNNIVHNKNKLTVGITTCYSGPTLVKTVKSLRASKRIGAFRLIIVADRTPITPKVWSQLRRLDAEIIWNDKEGSQFKKFKQIISMVKTDILVFTQDDVLFNPTALFQITEEFKKNSSTTMVSPVVDPLSPVTRFESTKVIAVHIANTIGKYWNNGDNYLMASGRCLAFRMSTLNKFRIPGQVVNGDTYLYLENKRLKGSFRVAWNGSVFIRCPQTAKDELGPSSRYQYSKIELSRYFDFDISHEYQIPLKALVRAGISQIIKNPILLVLSIATSVSSRLHRYSLSKSINPVWKVDVSTKNV